MNRIFATCLLLMVLAPCTAARDKKNKGRSLQEYISSLPRITASQRETTPGSIWMDDGRFANLASDNTARRVGDTVVIHVMEQTSAENSGSVGTQRKFSANSGITAAAGQLDTAGIEALFSPSSTSKLQGQGQTASKSRLRTSLSGQVVAVLPGGALVVEAQRDVKMNNERQRLVVRGVVRGADLRNDNSVLSTSLSNLEIELEGKGVIADATRPPNWLVRTLLRIVGF